MICPIILQGWNGVKVKVRDRVKVKVKVKVRLRVRIRVRGRIQIKIRVRGRIQIKIRVRILGLEIEFHVRTPAKVSPMRPAMEATFTILPFELFRLMRVSAN